MEVKYLKETKNYLVVEKPAGIPTTYRSLQDDSQCLVKMVLRRYPDLANSATYQWGETKRDPREGGLLYRLDNDTSGVVVFARNQAAFEGFLKAQEEDAVLKKYIAIVVVDSVKFNDAIGAMRPRTIGLPENQLLESDNVPEVFEAPFQSKFLNFGRRDGDFISDEVFEINFPIGHSRKSSKRMVVLKSEKYKCDGEPFHYKTFFRVRKIASGLAFLEVFIKKGCRHQIRAHLDSIGLPILGDNVYGGGTSTVDRFRKAFSSNFASVERGDYDRLFLHCSNILLPQNEIF